MTWFTTLSLNPRRRKTRQLLGSPQAMHAEVMGAFPPDAVTDSADGRVLWRLDEAEGQQTLYMVSPEKPDLSNVVERAGWETSPARSADYEAFLNQLKRGQQWGFRLRANPVKALPRSDGPRGKVIPHVTVPQQISWLLKKSDRWGFEIPGSGSEGAGGDGPQVAVTSRGDRRFRRADPATDTYGRVTLRQAQFDGVLTVTDVDRLRHSLVRGIGRGKAYGCGLLTLRRI
ncbi:type I-E CRISPR-associated protein Cas6/Cse3/CasE [Nesterenkonia sp. CL21]|uniref:type I-E CRISPR-associated protein Cas6/Cse3/CasE n=1 Tax=Nesterenkonia sp. CL21 TaxID=3064894 RepID=UPI002878C77F|nr:type I-E CRISPR-associated protein Cas6/Cse3/CasE [Nesterenkonia sp. CL21]MDS2172673.1 type I-E CRISPR-associated protein Cas6/Cse3/CasE [Nesterenkonia sp. CL21]